MVKATTVTVITNSPHKVQKSKKWTVKFSFVVLCCNTHGRSLCICDMDRVTSALSIVLLIAASICKKLSIGGVSCSDLRIYTYVRTCIRTYVTMFNSAPLSFDSA